MADATDPLDGGTPVRGTPAPLGTGQEPVYDPAADGTVPLPVSQAISEVGTSIASAYNDVYRTVAETINDVGGSLTTAAEDAGKRVGQVAKAVSTPMLDSYGELESLGVAVPWGAGERAADLDDPTGNAIVARVLPAVMPAGSGSGVGTSAASYAPPAALPPPPPGIGGPPPSALAPPAPTDPGDCVVPLFGNQGGVTGWGYNDGTGFQLWDQATVQLWMQAGSPNPWCTSAPPVPPTVTPPPVPPVPPVPPIGQPPCPPLAPPSVVPNGCWVVQYGIDPNTGTEVQVNAGNAGRITCLTRQEVVCPPPVPPVPPTVPPVPPECPPGKAPNPSTGICEDGPPRPNTGGTGPGGSGQCCPPTVVQSPPVTVNVPQPPPPPPPPRTGTVTAPARLASSVWDNPAGCSLARQTATVPPPSPPAGGEAGGIGGRSWWLDAAATGATWLIPGVGPAIGSTIMGFGASRDAAVGEATRQTVGSKAIDVLLGIMPGSDLDTTAIAGYLATYGLASWAERITGAPVTYYFQSYQYDAQYSVPQYIPTQSALDDIYLTGRFTAEQWECYTRALGNLPNLHKLARDSKQHQSSLDELVRVWMRQPELTQDWLFSAARKIGVVDPAVVGNAITLNQWIPGPSDLIRYMVRDSADEEIAQQYKYDSYFSDKFTGQIKQWANSQGIDESVFLYHWRAHWELPSNTALYSMLHRLRPDRLELSEWEGQLPPGGLAANPKLLATRPPVVTADDVRYAMTVNDMAPGWIDALMAVSYHPITNTDARRAFEIGSFTERQLYDATRNNGYNDRDARLIVDYYKAEREKRVNSNTRILSAATILRSYKDGLIDWLTADNYLSDLLPDPDVRRRQIEKAAVQGDLETRAAAVKAIQKGYVYGEYDDDTAERLLFDAGVSGDRLNAVMARFRAAKMGHKKEVRVTFLCQWYMNRIITSDQYFERLLRLGYSQEDAGRISQTCHAQRAAKEAMNARNAADRLRREARQEYQDARRNLADVQRQIKEAKAELAKLQKESVPAGA